MIDEDLDGVYEVIIDDLNPGTDYEFKFLANEGWGNPVTESSAPAGSACDFNPNDIIIIMVSQRRKDYLTLVFMGGMM